MWPNDRFIKLCDIELPIIQAPMAGAALSDMVVAVSEAGGLGSLACALLSVEQVRTELASIRQSTSRPINLNFFCYESPQGDRAKELNWRRRLERYYVELKADDSSIQNTARPRFDDKMCDVVTEFHPEVVSFHFGLPERSLLVRVKKAGAKVLASATSVDEARWLEDRGCDAIIAQGFEAGGHRGMFLTEDVSTQVGTIALVPQVVDAVKVPVIAAGGIADARGIVAAFALGAAAVQIGTAYLHCPEARISSLHRQALKSAKDNGTAISNVFTGRPARAIVNRFMHEAGPMSDIVPGFPLAAAPLVTLRAKAEMAGSVDFTPLWSGQSAQLGRNVTATDLTKQLAAKALGNLRALQSKDDD